MPIEAPGHGFSQRVRPRKRRPRARRLLPLLGLFLPHPAPAATLADSAPAADAGPVRYQSIAPKPLAPEVALRNPGKGLEQAGKLYADGRFVYHKAVEADTDITYIRLPWVVLEREGDNRWDFGPLDAAIENTAARGKQAAFAVFSWAPLVDDFNYRQRIPDWYMDDPRHVLCTDIDTPAGCTYYRVDWGKPCPREATCNHLWAFNHDDPVFVRNQVELIEALRKRYDNPAWAAKIAYIDIRSIGSWSESHTHKIFLAGSGTAKRWPMPRWESHKAVLDAHLAFEHIPQLVNFDNDDRYRESDRPHPWDYACDQARLRGRPIGWRSDGIEVTGWEIDRVWAWSDAARNCWKTGPVSAEPMHAQGIKPEDLDKSLRRLKEWHASGFNNKWTSPYRNDPAYTAKVDTWALDAGYRLHVAEARIPRTAPPGAAFDLNVALANAGTAPLYRSFYSLKMRFTRSQDGTGTVIPLAGELSAVRPGEPAVVFTGAGRLPAGTYRVSVGIVQDPAFGSDYPVKLAQDASACRSVSSQWWCEIGTTDIE